MKKMDCNSRAYRILELAAAEKVRREKLLYAERVKVQDECLAKKPTRSKAGCTSKYSEYDYKLSCRKTKQHKMIVYHEESQSNLFYEHISRSFNVLADVEQVAQDKLVSGQSADVEQIVQDEQVTGQSADVEQVEQVEKVEKDEPPVTGQSEHVVVVEQDEDPDSGQSVNVEQVEQDEEPVSGQSADVEQVEQDEEPVSAQSADVEQVEQDEDPDSDQSADVEQVEQDKEPVSGPSADVEQVVQDEQVTGQSADVEQVEQVEKVEKDEPPVTGQSKHVVVVEQDEDPDSGQSADVEQVEQDEEPVSAQSADVEQVVQDEQVTGQSADVEQVEQVEKVEKDEPPVTGQSEHVVVVEQDEDPDSGQSADVEQIERVTGQSADVEQKEQDISIIQFDSDSQDSDQLSDRESLLDSISDPEFLPSEDERNAKCVMCEKEVFIACPQSDCLLYLCYDHTMTDCIEHKSASRFYSIEPSQKDSSSSSESDSNSRKRKRRSHDKKRVQRSKTHVDKKNTRKRKRNENTWHRKQSKQLRESGREYISYNGKTVQGKVCADGNLCHEKCKRKCNAKVPLHVRQQLFDAFYQLDGDSQNSYLFKSIEPYKPHLQRTDAKSHRCLSFHFKITSNCESFYVCKKAFCALHQVKNGKLNFIIKQIKSSASSAHLSRRGKHSNRPNKVPQESFKLVIDHIKLFPAEMSHYSRTKNESRSYLSSTLSISKMYALYCEWLNDMLQEKGQSSTDAVQLTPVSQRSYHEIFVSNFNFGFGSPRSDTCAVCDVGDDEIHKQKANKAFDQQKIDKQSACTNENTVHITFDLQKTLPLPKISTGKAFYLRQLWLYNAGVHMLRDNKNQAYFHIWTEDEAGRGCEELGSCLLAFVEESGIGNGTSPCHLIAWSDNCAGQNKNFIVVCLWQFLLLTKNFTTIDHKFPEPGHSFLDSDRDFAQIEKLVRKHENIYTVDQYAQIFLQSQIKQKPVMTRMSSRFFSLKNLPALLGLFNNHTNMNGETVKFRDGIRWIRVTEFGSYQYRESFDESESWKTVVIKRPSAAVIDPSIEVLLPRLSSRVKRVSAKKLADVEKQLPFVPLVYRSFYQDLIANAANPDVESSEKSDVENSENEMDQPVSGTTQSHDLQQPALRRIRQKNSQVQSSQPHQPVTKRASLKSSKVQSRH